MATTFSLAINNKTGTLTSPAVDVPAGATNVVIDFDGSTLLDPAISIDTKIEFAPDGVTWRQIGGADFQCGGKKRDGVTPLPVYPTSTDIPIDGANRQLRGTLTIIGGTISTVLHISTSP
jgi:hypothetical protein